MLKITCIGNVGNDAIVNNLGGRNVINFSIASNKKYKDEQGNPQEITKWLSCSFWRDEKQSTEVAQYLLKGTKVYVEGEPETKLYTDTQGRPATALNCNVKTLELLSAKQDRGTNIEPNGRVNEQEPGEQMEPNKKFDTLKAAEQKLKGNQDNEAEALTDDLPF